VHRLPGSRVSRLLITIKISWNVIRLNTPQCEFSKDLDGKAYSDVLKVFDICLELPSDSEKYQFGFVVVECSELVQTRKSRCSLRLKLFVARLASKKHIEFWSLFVITKRFAWPIWFCTEIANLSSLPWASYVAALLDPHLRHATILTCHGCCRRCTRCYPSRNLAPQTRIFSNHLPPPCKVRNPLIGSSFCIQKTNN